MLQIPSGSIRTWKARIAILAVGLVAVVAFVGCGNANSATSTDLSITFKPSATDDLSLTLPCRSNCSTNLHGKVILINFWATWCRACKSEIPSLIEFQQKYADRGFTVVGVAMDDGGAGVVDPFVRQVQFDTDGGPMAMNYPIVIGSDSVAEKFGGLWAFPTSVLLGRDGRIAKRIVGTVSPDDLRDIQQLIGAS